MIENVQSEIWVQETVPCDKAGLANTLLSQEDQLELPEQLNMIFRKLDEKIWIFQV